MNVQLIYDQLPSEWNQINLEQFQKLMVVKITTEDDVFNGVLNTLECVSVLSGIPVEELEELPMKDIQRFAEKVQFLLKTPTTKRKDSTIKWKAMDEITYNDFISFIQFGDKVLENLHVFVKNFSTNNLSTEEILALPIDDVLVGFAEKKKNVQKYLTSFARSKIKEIKKKNKAELKEKTPR